MVTAPIVTPPAIIRIIPALLARTPQKGKRPTRQLAGAGVSHAQVAPPGESRDSWFFGRFVGVGLRVSGALGVRVARATGPVGFP
jgi:hypothetical protein